MSHWAWEPIKRALQGSLAWIEAHQRKTAAPRRHEGFLAREIHIPTPLITGAIALVLFALLIPQVGFDPHRILALAGLILLGSIFFVLYFRADLPEFANDDEAVLLTGTCLLLGVGMIEAARFAADEFKGIPMEFSLYGVPLAAVGIVAALLLNIRAAFLISVVLALVAGILNRMSFNSTAVAFFGMVAAILASRRVRRRSDIVWAGVHIIWVSAACLYGLGLFHDWTVKVLVERVAVWPAVNAGLSVILALGLLPLLESFFSRVTPITLLEVGDFNRPLLRQLMLEAPGTYHHTLLVSSLAEAAAEAVGANSLLCRVGMYYHDIGKLAHPEYFIENQTMRRDPKEEPERHPKLKASISSLVIMSHVKDGMALAKAHKVPSEVSKFIVEHHGTSLIKYFYMRALEQDDEQTPPPESFRYPGPRPRSKETVIGMLADSVEAASRTVEEPTYDRLKDLVEKIVNSKYMDGQFDEAPITLQDLRKIIDSFVTSLSAMYHVRIEYPELPNQDEEPTPIRPRVADE